MSEIIERVARAIDPLAWTEPLQQSTEFRRHRSRELAVAALLAAREPTEAQIIAVDRACHEHWPNARKMAVAMQAAMIDAALSDPNQPARGGAN